MSQGIDPRAPSFELLRARARRRMPSFAFDYVSGGCLSEVNLARNTSEIREIQLQPYYLRDYTNASLDTELFGVDYDAPFGVAPIGLQGLIWPKSCEILAEAATQHNIPFILSTVSTASIETVAKITKGRAWFQLYHPTEDDLRDKLLKRAADAGIKTLVALADTPVFGYRPKEIRNGLSIPPRMTMKNIVQMCLHPRWSFGQLAAGAPEFKTMKPYLPPGMSMKHLGLFMNKTFSGRLTEDKLKALRDRWDGNVVIKGIVNEEDAEKAITIGADGLIVSNHGGRQLDAGESTIRPLARLAKKYRDRLPVMMDSGIRSGSDIAVSLACGAHFTFLGRTMMFGVAALGSRGGDHTIAMLKRQLTQVMEQVACEKVNDLTNHLIEG